jgi:hypothetical protein
MLSFAFRRASIDLSSSLNLAVTLSGAAVIDYDYTTTGFSTIDAANNSAVVIIPAGSLEQQVTCTPVAGLTQPDQQLTLTISAAPNVERDLIHISATGTLVFNGGGGGYGYGYGPG